MPAWFYVVAVAAVLFVAWVAFARRWVHAVWYSWRAAHHAYREIEAEYGSLPTFYGSMLPTGDPAEDAVTARMLRYGDISAPPGGLGWREQTRVELAPETLDLLAAPIADPGPGGGLASSSPLPGPDQDTPLQAQMAAILRQRAPTRLADTADVTAAHEAHPSPDWQEAQRIWRESTRAELFDWVRAMVPQVTGWSVGL